MTGSGLEKTSTHQAHRLFVISIFDYACRQRRAVCREVSWLNVPQLISFQFFLTMFQSHKIHEFFLFCFCVFSVHLCLHHTCFPYFSSSQGSFVSWSTTRSTSSHCPAPTPAPSSQCPGWSWGGKSPSAALRAATLPPSPFTLSLSMEGRCTGEYYSAVLSPACLFTRHSTLDSKSLCALLFLNFLV